MLRGALMRGERRRAADLLSQYKALLVATDGATDAAWQPTLELLLQAAAAATAATAVTDVTDVIAGSAACSRSLDPLLRPPRAPSSRSTASTALPPLPPTAQESNLLEALLYTPSHAVTRRYIPLQEGNLLEVLLKAEEYSKLVPTGRGSGSACPAAVCLLLQASS